MKAGDVVPTFPITLAGLSSLSLLFNIRKYKCCFLFAFIMFLFRTWCFMLVVVIFVLFVVLTVSEKG